MTKASESSAPDYETPEEKSERIRKARLAGLEKARQVRAANKARREEEAAAARAGSEEERPPRLVRTSSAELRELKQSREEADAAATAAGGAQGEQDEPSPDSEGLRSVEDIAARVAARDDYPSVEVAAREVELDTGGGALPPPETNPDHNRGVRSSAEIPDTSDRTPRRIEDLVDLASVFAPGEWYIDVDRRSPTHVNGVPCGGIQRPIREPMNPLQFAHFYGGGNYTLILYGPPRTGAKFDANTGQQRFTKYGKPVKVQISNHMYPTNVASTALDEDDEEFEDEDMRNYQGFSRRGPASQADAAMHRADLEHEREIHKRQEEREERYRREAQEAQAGLAPVIDVLQQTYAQQQETLRQDQREREKERAEERRRAAEEKKKLEEQLAQANSRPSDFQAMADMLGNVLGRFGTDGSSKEALAEVRRQLDTLKDRHEAEMQRLGEKHQNELNNQRAEFDRQRERDDRNHRDDMARIEQRVKEAEDRADKRVTEAEQRAERELRELKDRADRELREEREQAQRRHDDYERTWKQRLDDMQRQHERDLSMKDQTFEMRLSSTKDSYENRLSMMGSEQVRMQSEIDRARAEAESNKDIVGQVTRLKETAGLLGMSDGGVDEEELPRDWRGMVAYVAKHAFQNIPQIMSQAGSTVRELRGNQNPAQLEAAERARMLAQAGSPAGVNAALRGRDGEPFQPTHPFVFGTEDGPGFDDAGEAMHIEPRPPRPPEVPGGVYAPVQPVQDAAQFSPPPMPIPAQPTMAPPQAPMAQPQPQSMVVANPQPPPRQAAPPPQPPPQAIAAPGPAVPRFEVTNEMLVGLEQGLNAAFSERASPEEVAENLIQDLGAPQALAIASGLDPEDVASRLMHMGMGKSPFVRPAGKRWLAEIIQAINEMASQQ